MSKELPPYVNATGILQRLFQKIKEAAIPSRVTQDFIATKLGLGDSGSTKAMIPYLKKIGFIGADGTPTKLYEKFRSPDEKKAGIAIAQGMKIGYSDLYERNEYFHTLTKDALKNFLIEATGADAKNAALTSLTNTLDILKSMGTFDIKEDEEERGIKEPVVDVSSKREERGKIKAGFNISYTINLNLPETSDSTVFDAIFRSLKEHILSNEKE